MTPEMQILGMTAAIAPGVWWLAGLVLAALLVLAIALAWRASGAGRMRALRGRLDGLDIPAAASTVGGRVL